MKLLIRWFASTSLILCALTASAGGNIKVMTLNQYLGSDLTPLLVAQDADKFNEALVAILTQAARSDFRSRAIAQAEAIAHRAPDVVALQEVWRLSCQDGDSKDKKGCEDPKIANAFVDHLTLTLKALRRRGFKYESAALVKNLDLEKITDFGLPGIPFMISDSSGVQTQAFLVAVDRDAILVREDVKAKPVAFDCAKPSADGCNYQVVAETDTPIGPLAVERGFVAIDARLGRKKYRIFNTHLEVKGEDVNNPLFTFYQASQAYELIETIALTTPLDKTLLLLGDINSSPVQQNVTTGNGDIVTPYNQFLMTGYVDIWDFKLDDHPGYTCCQQEDLMNRQSALSERIDMIFSLDEPEKVKNARVIIDKVSTPIHSGGRDFWFSDDKNFEYTGANVMDLRFFNQHLSKKPKPHDTGLWFSDHGAVTAEIRY